MNPTQPLTVRELSVLIAAAHGLSQRQTAERLRLSRKAVKRALVTAVERLGATGLVHAVAVAIRLGLIDANAIPGGPT